MPAFAPKRLTTVNPQAAGFAHGEQRVVTWKSAADSESIEGILTLPVGYQRGARVPLLLVIHGGPAGVSSARYPSTRGAYPVQVFSSLGYAVLQPNYRGSTGYGARFRGLNKGDIMGKDWIDVNSGVDEMVRSGIADSTKLGIMGWSFGGFHTFWGITQTRRFAAASAGAGANDLTSFYSQTDISEYLGMLQGAPPWENPNHYLQRSAYRKVQDVTTPLLIQVGESDRRVSPEQSIQFYEAMKGVRKAPVKLVLYPGQGHGVNDPRLSRDLMQRNVAWFTYWVPVTGNKPPVRVADGPGTP
jgi:dipeptidyl aminopeptidase/acylaminoacyl peptidase